MIDESSLPDDFLFPKFLHGTYVATRDGTAKFIKKIWRGQPEGDTVDVSALVDVRDIEGDLILQRAMFGPPVRGNELHWHLHHVPKALTRLRLQDNKTKDPKAVRDHAAQIMLSGADHLWFALGLLTQEAPDALDFEEDNGSVRGRDFHRAILGKIVEWLGQIQTLAPRFAKESIDAPACREIFPHFWTAKFYGFLGGAGYVDEAIALHAEVMKDQPPDGVLSLPVQHEDVVSQTLLQIGLIVEDNGRFKLNDVT